MSTNRLVKALYTLNVRERIKQIALLNNLYFSEQLIRSNIQKAVDALLPHDIAIPAIREIEKVLQNLSHVSFVKRGEYLLDNLFNSELYNQEDLEDLLVYIIQNAYARYGCQERQEIAHEPWTIDKTLYCKYYDNARILGLTEAMLPNAKCDEIWLLGSTRCSMITKYLFIKKYLANHRGNIKILSGYRELYAEISGIGNTSAERTAEGKLYILSLARKYNIIFDSTTPFITKNNNLSPEIVLKRTYLNYIPSEKRRVTEVLMAYDMFREYLQTSEQKNSALSQEVRERLTIPKNTIDITNFYSDTLETIQCFNDIDKFSVNITNDFTIITAPIDNTILRPTTETTAICAAIALIYQTNFARPLTIGILSSQPSIMRQTIQIKRILNTLSEVIPHCAVDLIEMGPAEVNKNITVIHSELATLIAESYYIAVRKEKRKRNSKQLMLQTRMY